MDVSQEKTLIEPKFNSRTKSLKSVPNSRLNRNPISLNGRPMSPRDKTKITVDGLIMDRNDVINIRPASPDRHILHSKNDPILSNNQIQSNSIQYNPIQDNPVGRRRPRNQNNSTFQLNDTPLVQSQTVFSNNEVQESPEPRIIEIIDNSTQIKNDEFIIKEN